MEIGAPNTNLILNQATKETQVASADAGEGAGSGFARVMAALKKRLESQADAADGNNLPPPAVVLIPISPGINVISTSQPVDTAELEQFARRQGFDLKNFGGVLLRAGISPSQEGNGADAHQTIQAGQVSPPAGTDSQSAPAQSLAAGPTDTARALIFPTGQSPLAGEASAQIPAPAPSLGFGLTSIPTAEPRTVLAMPVLAVTPRVVDPAGAATSGIHFQQLVNAGDPLGAQALPRGSWPATGSSNGKESAFAAEPERIAPTGLATSSRAEPVLTGLADVPHRSMQAVESLRIGSSGPDVVPSNNADPQSAPGVVPGKQAVAALQEALFQSDTHGQLKLQTSGWLSAAGRTADPEESAASGSVQHAGQSGPDFIVVASAGEAEPGTRPNHAGGAGGTAAAAVDLSNRIQAYDQLENRLATALGQQIAAQVSRGVWELNFRLHPAELGRVDVRVGMAEGKLGAVFSASNANTQQLLEQGFERLRSVLNDAGFRVANLGIESSAAGMGDGQRGSQAYSAELVQAAGVRASRAAEPAAEFSAAGAFRGAAGDSAIDLFV